MNALAQIGGERQVIAPGSIDLEQHHRPLGRADGVLADLVDQRAPAGRALARPPAPRHPCRMAWRAAITSRRCPSTTDA